MRKSKTLLCLMPRTLFISKCLNLLLTFTWFWIFLIVGLSVIRLGKFVHFRSKLPMRKDFHFNDGIKEQLSMELKMWMICVVYILPWEIIFSLCFFFRFFVSFHWVGRMGSLLLLGCELFHSFSS